MNQIAKNEDSRRRHPRARSGALLARLLFPFLVLAIVLLPGLVAGCAPAASLCAGKACGGGTHLDLPDCSIPPGLTEPPVALKPLFPLDAPIVRASGAGSTPGSGQVSATGEYQYRVPLDLPAGRAGVQPALALVYGSREKNDQLGVGWQLDGLSAISRCPTTFATEGRADGVHLDEHDALCLDGHKLIAIQGVPGADGTEYRTEDEVFARIVAVVGEDKGIDRFQVWTKEGRVRSYKAIDVPETDSQPVTDVAWPIEEEADRSGNSIRFSYDVKVEADYRGHRRLEYHPSQIDYTFTIVAGLVVDPGRRRIVFEYEDRPDPSSVYLGGVEIDSTKRIREIGEYYVPAGGPPELTAKYKIGYELSTGSGRSLLSDIRRCGPEGGCLLSKIFHWQSSAGPSFKTVPIEALPPDGENPLTLDVDGDGTDEILSSHWFLRSTTDPALPLAHRVEIASDPISPGFAEVILEKSLILDIDGDGANEILGPIASDDPAKRGYYLFRYNALAHTFWRPAGPPLEPTKYSPNASAPFEEPVSLVDLDGDGLVDMVKAEAPDPAVANDKWHWFYRHNEGGSFGPKVPLDVHGPPLQSATTGHTFMFPLDLAGDYRGSVFFSQVLPVSPLDSGTLQGFRLDRDGNQETVQIEATASFVSTIFGDVNGDGLEDEIWGENDVGVNANTGRTEELSKTLVVDGLDWADIPFNGEVDQLLTGDLDGDGREDILAFHRNQLGIDELMVLRLGAAQKLEAIPFGVHARSTLGDFDGDGRLDLAYWSNGLFKVDRGTGETFDRITEIHESLGPHALEEVDYVTEPLPIHGICDFPQRRITQSFTVVREHRLFQGEDVVAAGEKEQRHIFHYRGPRADAHGRGFLGFSVVEEWDPDRLAETVTTYDNVSKDKGIYPFAFLPVSIQRAVVIELQGARARLNRVDFKNEIDHLNGGKTYFVHPSAFRSLEWEEDVTVDLDEKAELHLGAIDGADEHSALRVRHGSSTYDKYGNVLTETRSTLHGVETTTVSTYEYRVDDWLVGLLSTQTTTSAISGAFPPPVGRHVAYEYEGRGLLCHVFLEKDDPDPAVPEVLTYTHDGEGLVRAVTASAVGVPSRTTHMAYEQDERVYRSQIWNDLGHSQWFLRDSAMGVLLTSEDANGVLTKARYDDLGRPIELHPDGGDSATIDYDPRISEGGGVVGLSVLTSLGSGAKMRADYDELGRPIGRGHLGEDGTWIEEATRYDLLGRAVHHTRPGFGTPSSAGVTSIYDNLDRRTQEIRPGNATTTFVSTFFETHVTDPMFHESYVLRDFDDRIVKSVQITSGNELATLYQYGDFDQVARITDPLGNKVVAAYDQRGRRWLSDDPDAGTTVFTYNGFGDLTSKVINGSASTIPTYDLLGRVTGLLDDDGASLTVWDISPHGIGRVAHAESPDGIDQDFTYDAFSRPLGQSWTVDGASYTFGFTYDDHGRLASLAYPAIPGKDPFTIARHYTKTGYLDSVYEAAVPQNKFWHATARNADDALLQGTLGNGIPLIRTYNDETGRLESISEGSALSLSYEYDFDGAVQSKYDALAKRIETFSYDDLHRLGSWTLSTIVPGAPGFPDATPTLHQTIYDYDPIGNLTKITRDGSLQEHNVYGEEEKPHALTSNMAGAYHYDDRGRQQQTSKRSVTYTEHDLPRTIDTAAGQTRFSYDAAGRRVKKIGPDASLITLAGLYERHESSGKVRHVFTIEGGEGPVAQRSYEEGAGFDSTEYLHLDPLGSVGAISNQAGKVLHALYYEPFGARRDKDGDPAAPPPKDDPRLGFAGHTHDDDLGLIDMRGRVYDPGIRRFLTPDPHVTAPLFGQSYNRYSYVVNNPVNLTDPSGFDFENGTSGGCGFDVSCSGGSGTDAGFSFSVGGPSAGGSSAPGNPSGVKIASSAPKRGTSLPAGAGLSSGALAGPRVQAWGERHGAAGVFAETAITDYLKSAALAPVSSLVSMYGAGQTGLAIAQALRNGDVGTAADAAARMLPVAGPTLALRDLYWSHDWGIASAEMKAEAIAHAIPLAAGLVVDAVMISAASSGAAGEVRGSPGSVVQQGRGAVGDLTLFHGTDIGSARGFLGGAPLDAAKAAAGKIDGPLGFFLATHAEDAAYFAARRGTGTILEYRFSAVAVQQLGGLSASPLGPLGKFGRFAGSETMVPIESFKMFNQLRAAGEITVAPSTW